MATICASPGMNGFDCSFGLANFTKARNGIEMRSQIEGDADVAGPGIVASFVAAVIASMATALILLIIEAIEIRHHHSKHSETRWWNGLDQFLVAWSDQQLVLGIATCIAIAYFRCSDGFSNYHMNVINQWLLLSLITHTNALLVHCGYMSRRYRHVGCFRLFGVFFFVVFAAVLLFDPHGLKWYPAVGNHSPLQVLPAPCFYRNATSPSDFTQVPGWGVDTTSSQSQFLVALIFALLAWASAMLHAFWVERKGRVSFLVRGLVFLGNLVLGCFALASTFQLRGWIHSSPYMASDASTGENGESEWSYGQMVAIMVSFITLFSVAEIFAADIDEDK